MISLWSKTFGGHLIYAKFNTLISTDLVEKNYRPHPLNFLTKSIGNGGAILIKTFPYY